MKNIISFVTIIFKMRHIFIIVVTNVTLMKLWFPMMLHLFVTFIRCNIFHKCFPRYISAMRWQLCFENSPSRIKYVVILLGKFFQLFIYVSFFQSPCFNDFNKDFVNKSSIRVKGQLAPRKLTFDNVTIINMGQEITIDQKTNLLWPTVRALE